VPQGSFEASSSRNGSAPPEVRPNLIALVSLTHTLCEAGRVQEAEELCRLILKEQPTLAIAQAALGRALYEAGKLDEAEISLERTVGQTPGCFAAHRWLAEVLVQKGAWDHAQMVLAQAAILSPENPRVRQLLQTLPQAPPQSPTATAPGRPAHGEAVAAQIEQGPRRRPRTTEYPPPEYEELPYVPVQPMGSEDIEEFVTEPHVTGLRPLTWRGRLHRWRLRTVGAFQRQDWRAVGAAAAIGLGLATTIGVGLSLMSGPAQTLSPQSRASAPAPLSSKPAPPPVPAEAVSARRDLETAIQNGDLPSLLAAAEHAAPSLSVPEVASARLFASALLATEYGVPIPQDTHMLLRRLMELGPVGQVAREIDASRVLLEVSTGNLDAPLPTEEQAAEHPWLAFSVAKVRRLSGAPLAARAAASTDGGPSLVLHAEALIDAGETARARALLIPLIERTPAYSRARLALAEARLANGPATPAPEAAGLRGACALDGPRSPTVEGACKLISAEEARRAGDRAAARSRALQVATLAPPDARVLARTAQLLANLGETRRAQELTTRASALAGPGYAPLMWAGFGLRLNRGELVAPENLPPISGPQARLLSLRAALASGGAAAVGAALRGMGPQINSDPDMGWFVSLSRIQRRRTAVKLAEQFREPGARAPGPTGSYVLGLLARWGERRQLASYWLTRAREGHGDACSAAALYVALETEVGRKPMPGAIPPDCPRRKRR
jgi:tetratricopeptide (TPR) repeat protein